MSLERQHVGGGGGYGRTTKHAWKQSSRIALKYENQQNVSHKMKKFNRFKDKIEEKLQEA